MFSVEKQIEYLCSCEFSDYKLLKNQIRLEGALAPSKQSSLRSLSETRAEQDEWTRRKKRLQEFEDYKKTLRAKATAEIHALVGQRMADAANREQQELFARIDAERQKLRPDWGFWLHMPDVELWQACALSLDIDPDKMEHEPHGWIAGPGSDQGPFFTLTSFPSKAVEEDFNKRLRLAKAHHGGVVRKRVPLSEFAIWALSITLFKGMPAELIDLEKMRIADPATNQEEQPTESQLVAPIPEIGANNTTKTAAVRIKPRAGDSLTPMIWEICHDLHEAGDAVTSRPVMAELKRRAQQQEHPLVGTVAGGVAYEYEKGDERELNSEQLRSRIKEWKKAIGGD